MENMDKKVERMVRGSTKRRLWKRFVAIPAAVVVFVTTYALILPAIAMERDTYCGIDPHQHTEECYTAELTCGYEDGQILQSVKTVSALACNAAAHQHTEACFDETGAVICGYADYLVHEHTADCYNEQGELVCPLPEVKAHTHDESCYATEIVNICGQIESEGHVHDAQLGRGEKKSCGCLRRMPRPIHVGQRFGALTVIADAGSGTGRQLWRCKCDCGSECVVSASKLNRGKVKSCGCLRPRSRGDLTGQRFGMLTVLGPAEREEGKDFWQCRCDCGGKTVVWQQNLLSGHTKSCGCLQRQVYKENLRQVDGTSVTLIERCRQAPIASNTSGYNGVYRNKRSGRWTAQITFKGKTYYLGSFDDIEDAVKARRKGEEIYDDFLEWYYDQRSKASTL